MKEAFASFFYSKREYLYKNTYMEISLKKLGDKLLMGFFYLVCLWIGSALCFQLFFVYLMVTGQDDRAGRYSNEITWKIDGRFKNNPDNIWYEGPKK